MPVLSFKHTHVYLSIAVKAVHVRWCHFEFNAKVGSKGVQDISIEMSSKRIAIECANAMDFLTRAAHPWHALFGIWDLGWRRRDVGRANLKHLAVPTSITNHESIKSRFFVIAE